MEHNFWEYVERDRLEKFRKEDCEKREKELEEDSEKRNGRIVE